MQYLNMRKAIGLFMALAFFAGGTQTAFAVGTASGISIDNTATVDYQVGGFDQATVTSNTESFVVDNRVDLTVTNVSGTNVLPSSTNQPLAFTVTNTGNTTQGYSLTATNAAGDDFDMTLVDIYLDDGNGSWDGVGVETLYTAGTNAFDLAADITSRVVYVVANTPGTVTNGQTAVVDLLATTLDAGTNNVTGETVGGNTAGIDVVFGDGAGTVDVATDGQHSTAGTYTVAIDALTLVKSSSVEEDPFNGTTNPKAIPGARIRYTLLVSNPSATNSATSVIVVDDIPVNTTYVAGSITLGAVAKTDAADADEADYNVTNTTAVTVNVGTLAAGASTTITFDVTVD
jgi:uncharacterized repeat protein (TIGR01451 family)